MKKTNSERIEEIDERLTSIETLIKIKPIGKKLICPRCGNVWNYKGDKLTATCTSCGNKVRIE
ncbi:MAG TPA: hypothetical protein VGB37_00620 [Candidatus Lokiarchaeia archaeon]